MIREVLKMVLVAWHKAITLAMVDSGSAMSSTFCYSKVPVNQPYRVWNDFEPWEEAGRRGERWEEPETDDGNLP